MSCPGTGQPIDMPEPGRLACSVCGAAVQVERTPSGLVAKAHDTP